MNEDELLKTSVGGIVINDRGEVLLRKSSRISQGEMWTFAKGHPRPSETHEECAIREVLEETGVEARIVRRLTGSYRGSTTISTYFLMTVKRDTGVFDDETVEVRWSSLGEATDLISRSPYEVGRKRDLEVLKAVQKMTDNRNIDRARMATKEHNNRRFLSK